MCCSLYFLCRSAGEIWEYENLEWQMNRRNRPISFYFFVCPEENRTSIEVISFVNVQTFT